MAASSITIRPHHEHTEGTLVLHLVHSPPRLYDVHLYPSHPTRAPIRRWSFDGPSFATLTGLAMAPDMAAFFVFCAIAIGRGSASERSRRFVELRRARQAVAS